MRFGLLGTGHWAADTHGATLAAHPQAEVVGVWGRDPAKAAAVAAQLAATPYDDADALFADVDAVAVALPPDVQAGFAVRAARAGCHLLLDKALELVDEDTDEVVAAVDGAGVAALVFFTNRFRPEIERFLADANRVGGWYAARGVMHASIFQPGNPYGASAWRREHGGLWDIGPHALSVVLPVLGDVTEITAVDGPRGTVNVIARHVNGAASELSITLNAAPNATVVEQVFYGENGVAVVPDHRQTTSLQAYSAAIDRLLAMAGTGAGDPCDVHFGRTVVRILAAADTARKERRAVAL
ncbi:Gfo/Idh/MocA family oxidoreductase [Virgisporangium ochraceum]